MIYRALGVWEYPSGLLLSFAEFHENAGQWTHETKFFGNYPAGNIVKTIDSFISQNNLKYRVALITIQAVSYPNAGALIAAETGLPVITDLQALDLALGGNGEFFISIAGKLGMNATEMTERDKAVCVAFMGILRWREEYNFLSSITGASRNSIGGAVWLGQEA